jgi:hypothetical protein
MTKLLSKEYLHELFEYRDGKLFWKICKAKRIKVGQEAGCHKEKGYFHAGIDGTNYLIHRLVFCWHNGFMPEFIDHIDGNPSNNKIENLRIATRSQNNCNSKIQKNNKSGVRGVAWIEARKRWVVNCQVNKKAKQIGYFKDFELAELVAKEAQSLFHGEYARKESL